MKRLQKKHLGFKGGITPFLSLVFILLLSLAGAMLQSASIQTSKSVRRAEMSLALENVFAEYQVDLLKDYDVFAREGSSEREIKERLKFYGVVETEHEVMESVLLSDLEGEAFYRQAIVSMGGRTETVDTPAEFFRESEGEIVENQLEEIMEKEEVELPVENNPMEVIKILKNSNLLSLIHPNQEQISNRNISLDDLPTHRTLEKGVGNTQQKSEVSVKNKALFALYLTEHFPCMLEESMENPLAYEAEYLLEGKSSDRENLTAVAKKILGIRMTINYGYLLTDSQKQLEAEVLALGLGSLFAAPEAAEVLKYAVLFAWAYGESIVDLQVLFQGKKVPIVKRADTWQLTLENVFQLVEGENEWGNDFEEGVRYTDYIKMLLITEEKETLCMRALDLIEINTGVHIDNCLTGLVVKSRSKLQRDITYTFQTEYWYE